MKRNFVFTFFFAMLRCILLFVFIACVFGESNYPELSSPTCSGALANAVIQPGYCPTVWADGLGGPRTLEIAENGDVLTVEASYGRVSVLWDDNNDGKSSSNERAILATNHGLNHAVRINGNFLYASNATTVLRWPYQAGDRSNLGTGELVVRDIPCCHHVTRALAFDAQNNLYVQVGSGSNVDPDATHARVNRFNITEIPDGGINWNNGYVFANGLRNEAGIRFDLEGNLWGVENGVDNEYRSDLGGDLHNTNPCEELNFLQNDEGLFFGYPYCWSAYNITDYERGTQFYQYQFSSTVTDAWCQDPANVIKPKLCMEPHMAPLDVLFWDNSDWSDVAYGDAFVSFHGSWNRNPPAGYRVDRVIYENGTPVHNEPFLGYKGPGAYTSGWLRPVGLASSYVEGKPALFVSSDGTGQIVLIQYTGN